MEVLSATMLSIIRRQPCCQLFAAMEETNMEEEGEGEDMEREGEDDLLY